jgi:hypothetical protein
VRLFELTRLCLGLQRKCWWDGVQVEVPLHEGSDEMVSMKVWARRVWTLELSLVSPDSQFREICTWADLQLPDPDRSVAVNQPTLAHQQSTRHRHLLSLPSYVPIICQPSARILIPPFLSTRYVSLFDLHPRPFALVLCCLHLFAHTRLPNPLGVVNPAMTLLVDHDIRLRQSPVVRKE